MDSLATTESINCLGKKADKSRRCWTTPEEEVLITAWKDVISKGYKSENGFRNGYLPLLESTMKSVFCNTDIRGHLHITSKIHVWKKNYSSLSSMLAKSGIGWNQTENMLAATNEAWEAQLKVDNNVRVMRYKRWPYYEDWCEIFGNDRATGSRAESFLAAVNDVLNLEEQVPNDVQVHMEDMYRPMEGDGESMSVNNSTPSNPSVGTKVKSKKRKKITEGDDKIVVAINNLADITKETMSNLIKQMAAEKKLAESQIWTACWTHYKPLRS
ncbi:uncharacterized protein [Primulina eburnea]|uniref:uncharacterized protein n=1 Tax=Primulina eburnea TaxID=1245227 RepID=UPI003C6C8572